MKFKKGDIVEAFGVKGIVGHAVESSVFCVRVDFGDPGTYYFTEDGRYEEFHKEPSLKLVERPLKKKKVKIEGWAHIYTYPGIPGTFIVVYSTLKDAQNSSHKGALVYCSPFKGEWEVDDNE